MIIKKIEGSSEKRKLSKSVPAYFSINSITMNLGIEYKLSSKLSVYIESELRYAIKSKEEKDMVNKFTDYRKFDNKLCTILV